MSSNSVEIITIATQAAGMIVTKGAKNVIIIIEEESHAAAISTIEKGKANEAVETALLKLLEESSGKKYMPISTSLN